MARRSRNTITSRIETGRACARALVAALLLCVGGAPGWAQQDHPQKPDESRQQQEKQKQQPTAAKGSQEAPQPSPAQPSTQAPQPAVKRDDTTQQMKGLDAQIQDIKSDVLSISAELNQLEEKLMYPSGTQVAIFVSLAKGDPMRLDAVRLKIDGRPAADYIYSAKELEALRKGGVQRIYVGNVTTGDHQLEVAVEGKGQDGSDFTRTGQFTFRKEVKPKLVGLTLAGPASGGTPITIGDW